MTPEAAFGASLRTMRRKRGFSQERLAEACGFHPNYIGLLERGMRGPTLTTLFRLAAALDTTAVDLIVLTQAANPMIPSRTEGDI